MFLMTASKQGQDGNSVLNLLGSCHQKPTRNLSVPNVQSETPDDGQRRCPKHVEIFDKIKFGKFLRLVGFIKKKFVTMHGHTNVKNTETQTFCAQYGKLLVAELAITVPFSARIGYLGKWSMQNHEECIMQKCTFHLSYRTPFNSRSRHQA
jgi:hypothetical protein